MNKNKWLDIPKKDCDIDVIYDVEKDLISKFSKRYRYKARFDIFHKKYIVDYFKNDVRHIVNSEKNDISNFTYSYKNSFNKKKLTIP